MKINFEKQKLRIRQLYVRNPYATGVLSDLPTNRGNLTIWVTTFVLACVLQVAPQLTLADELSMLMSNKSWKLPQQTILFEEFAKNTGINVKVDWQNDILETSNLWNQADGAIPDTVTFNYQEATTACSSNLLIKYDSRTFPKGALADRGRFEPWSNGCVALPYADMMVFVTRIDEELNSIVDIFNSDKFEGELGLKEGPEFNLELALLADGVQPNEIYSTLITPEGQDRAFRKLDEIRGRIVWWDSTAQVKLLMNDIQMSSVWINEIGDWSNKSSELKIIWNDRISVFNYVAIPSSLPNPENAATLLELIASWMSAFQCPSGTCECVGSNVCDKKCCNTSIPLIYDSEFWLTNGSELRQQFQRWREQAY